MCGGVRGGRCEGRCVGECVVEGVCDECDLHSAWMANKFCIGLLHSCSTGIIGVQITELQITELQIKQPNLVS